MDTDHDRKTHLDPLAAITVFLHGIWKLLAVALRPREPFVLDLIVNAGGTATRQGGDHSGGIVKCIWNPTAGNVTVTLYDGETVSGLPQYNATISAGAAVLCWIPFKSQISASSGNGAMIAGEYRM